MVIATILVNPHVNAYDLLLLAPVCVLLANWARARRRRRHCPRRDEQGQHPGHTCDAVAAGPVVHRADPGRRAGCDPAAVLCRRMAAVLILIGYLLNRRIWFWMPWNAGATSAAVGA